MTTKMTRGRWRGGLLSALALGLWACGGDESDGGRGEFTSSTGFEARMTDGTVFVDDAMVASALIDADDDTDTYRFDVQALNDAGMQLAEGDVLLISKVALGRITSVTEDGGEVVVETEFAALTEAFEEADIDWAQEFEFTEEVFKNATIEFMGKEISLKQSGDPCNDVREGCLDWDAEVGEYALRGRIRNIGGDAEITVIMSKQVGNENVALRAENRLKPIRNRTNIEIRDSETRSFSFEDPDLAGEVKLSLAAAAGGVSGNLGFGPHTMLRFPFTVGPLPVVLAVKVRTVAQVEVTTGASATSQVTITYGGQAGIQYTPERFIANKDVKLENPTYRDGAGDLAAAIGVETKVQWGFTAPEMELQLFGNTLVPYLRPEFFLGAKLTWAPVCQNVNVRYNVSSGLDLRFLGQNLGTVLQTEVVPEQRRDFYSPADCGDDKSRRPSDLDFISFDP